MQFQYRASLMTSLPASIVHITAAALTGVVSAQLQPAVNAVLLECIALFKHNELIDAKISRYTVSDVSDASKELFLLPKLISD